MPNKSPRPCTKAGCHGYAADKKGRCEEHKIKAWDHNGKTRHERGYDNNWYRTRQLILKRDGHMCKCDDCTYDGVFLPANEVDHVIPKSRGGTDDHSNLIAINTECHKKKTAKESIMGRE